MKTIPRLLVLGSVLMLAAAQAAVIKFNLSPPGRDNAVGLSPANETPPVTNSTGSGDAISGGIHLDTTASNAVLHFAIGYGSAAGFTDLTGPATAAHIHGPATTNVPAGIEITLVPFLFPFVNPSNGGVIFGSVTLDSNQVTTLLAGSNYINIHTATNPGGEIRGQLIPVLNTAPQLVCPGDSTRECSNGPVNLTAHVTDAEGDAMTVTWTVNGTAVQTNDVPQGSDTNGVDVTLAANLSLGTNHVDVKVTDSGSNQTSCTSTIILRDTTPPVISGAVANPSTLWPPNHMLVPINITVAASDNCCATTWKIVSVTSNEPVGSGADPFVQWLLSFSNRGNGSGNTAPDWVITGDHGLSLRAERSGHGNGRVYCITVQAKDCAGNPSATRKLTVTVPHDQGHDHDN